MNGQVDAPSWQYYISLAKPIFATTILHWGNYLKAYEQKRFRQAKKWWSSEIYEHSTAFGTFYPPHLDIPRYPPFTWSACSCFSYFCFLWLYWSAGENSLAYTSPRRGWRWRNRQLTRTWENQLQRKNRYRYPSGWKRTARTRTIRRDALDGSLKRPTTR